MKPKRKLEKTRKPKQHLDISKPFPWRPSEILEDHRKRIGDLEAWLHSLAQVEPEWTAAYAIQVLEIATGILLGLIESKKLTNPQGFYDDAEARLCVYFERLNREVCSLAKNGREAPVSCAWRGAAELSKALHDLALASTPGNSDEGLFSLQKIAGRSIYMPSLRANVKKFDYDFPEIAKKIGLSLQSATNSGWSWTPKGFKSDGSQAKYDLNSLATQFVVQFVEHVSHLQKITREAQARLHSMKKLGATMPRFREYQRLTVQDLLEREDYSNEQISELMAYHDLPRFSGKSRPEFWKHVLDPHLEKYETLEQLRGSAFYKQLEDATDGKPYQMRDVLKKRCKQAFQSKTLVKKSDFP
jgi:hypothetical protein